MKTKSIIYFFICMMLVSTFFLNNGCDTREGDTGNITGGGDPGWDAVIGEIIVQPISETVYVPHPDSIVAGTIEITVVNASGTKISGVPTYVTSTLGTVISEDDTTDKNGKFRFQVYNYFDNETFVEGSANITIRCKASNTVTKSASVDFINEIPENSSLTILADPIYLTVNSDDESTIQAILKDQDNRAISNVNVIFSIGRGLLTSPASGVPTNENGIAETTYYPIVGLEDIPTEATEVTILAQCLGSVSGETKLVLVPPSGALPNSIVKVTGSPMAIYANHDEVVELTVSVKDSQNVGLSGIQVTLFSDVGYFDDYTLTTGQSGTAYTFFYDGFSDEDVPQEQVIAKIVAATAWDADEFNLAINPPPGETILEFSAAPEWTYADNGQTTSILSAVLTDEFGEKMNGKLVKFSTDIGRIIPAVAVTDSYGVATATFFDNFEQSPEEAVIANVSAKWDAGDIQEDIQIEILPAEAPVPASVELSVSATEIQVTGTGGQETSIITAYVYDQFGFPIFDGEDIIFTILNGPDGQENLNGIGETVTAPTSAGMAQATLYSGITSGTVKIKAVTENGISATTTGITIDSGPPHNVSVAYETALDGGEQIGGGLWQIEVSANITDIHSNPVPDSTAVHFSLWPDTLGASIVGASYTYNELEGGPGPDRGVAYTYLNYPSAAIFQAMVIFARCDTVEGKTAPNAAFPIQDPEIEVYVAPANLNFAEDSDDRWSKITALLKDGYGHPVNNGLLLFEPQYGILWLNDDLPHNAEEEISYDGFTGEWYPDIDDQIMGLPTDGIVRRYLRVYGYEFGYYAECEVMVTLFGTDITGDRKVYLTQQTDE